MTKKVFEEITEKLQKGERAFLVDNGYSQVITSKTDNGIDVVYWLSSYDNITTHGIKLTSSWDGVRGSVIGFIKDGVFYFNDITECKLGFSNADYPDVPFLDALYDDAIAHFIKAVQLRIEQMDSNDVDVSAHETAFQRFISHLRVAPSDVSNEDIARATSKRSSVLSYADFIHHWLSDTPIEDGLDKWFADNEDVVSMYRAFVKLRDNPLYPPKELSMLNALSHTSAINVQIQMANGNCIKVLRDPLFHAIAHLNTDVQTSAGSYSYLNIEKITYRGKVIWQDS